MSGPKRKSYAQSAAMAPGFSDGATEACVIRPKRYEHRFSGRQMPVVWAGDASQVGRRLSPAVAIPTSLLPL